MLLLSVYLCLVESAFLLYIFPRIPWELYYKLALLSLYLGLLAFMAFIRELFPNEVPSIGIKAAKYFVSAICTVVVFTPFNIYYYTMQPFEAFVILSLVYLFYGLIKSAVKKRKGAVAVLCGLLVVIAASINDILYHTGVVDTWPQISLGIFIFTFFQPYMLSSKYSKAFSDSEKLAGENERMYHEIKQLNDGLEIIVKEGTNELQESTRAVKSLLNNAGQGFLYFGSDLVIQKEYSAECKNIFEADIAGEKFTDLVYPNDSEGRKLTEEIFGAILTGEKVKQDIYLSLLPEEICISGRFISMEYKIMEVDGNCETLEFMVILTDVTEKRKLERQMKEPGTSSRKSKSLGTDQSRNCSGLTKAMLSSWLKGWISLSTRLKFQVTM